ncbi:hypothetical protein DWF00_11705 [Bosea caraganae]|uniref:Uncharacterized protein n=1 Tax=Bosea caraganae TaxID=2763117 RepID=A0A370LCM6_9HYPH|nr:hypothetical protein [Bosea caraganae]RDJ27595.1 hypothetical protein DWF00_11705 [Bosea caraganae]RDJ29609.1 hypothetical protein DWE98_03475 [Bosea caraganae]
MHDGGGVAPSFCSDAELGYLRSRTAFAPGAPLLLDEPYRLAHLPLVAPDHPGVIPRQGGKFYEMGSHPTVYSLVLPVDDAELRRSDAFLELEGELKAAPFAGKIAWDILSKRAGKLHATICGSLGIGEPPAITAGQRGALQAFGPVAVELRGLFSGNINRGRLYLRAYPERRDGANSFQMIQSAMGRPQTDLYVVGLYNLTDDLDAAEALALADILARWWERPLLRLKARELWLLGARDDLVLDAEITERLPLGENLHDRPAPARP